MKSIVTLTLLLALVLGGCDCKDSTAGNNQNNTLDSGSNNQNNGSDAGVNNVNNQNNLTDTGDPRDLFEQPDQIFVFNDMGVVLCGNGEPCACSNGMDDDGDGLIDGLDPECTGPYDDDEETFATGIPGDNQDPKWQDCFYDGNSGAGDDKCRYHTDCLSGAKLPNDPDCQVSQACFDFCRPRTPNGCDCFGCCEVFANGGSSFISIGGGCSVDDLSGCDTCIQTAECVNECGECELCPGRTLDDLPAVCRGNGGGDPPMNTCEDGETVCTQGADCVGASQYCLQGCCVFIPG